MVNTELKNGGFSMAMLNNHSMVDLSSSRTVNVITRWFPGPCSTSSNSHAMMAVRKGWIGLGKNKTQPANHPPGKFHEDSNVSIIFPSFSYTNHGFSHRLFLCKLPAPLRPRFGLRVVTPVQAVDSSAIMITPGQNSYETTRRIFFGISRWKTEFTLW